MQFLSSRALDEYNEDADIGEMLCYTALVVFGSTPQEQDPNQYDQLGNGARPC